ncbi:MAG: glycosyltransferase family 4 protein [Schleiferiaceae bacterium]|nr:glycosyltransferase family 4 protein [Schleiferiaceae bacterium]
MKILHITTPTSWRGGEQQLAYLGRELENLHVSNYVLCPNQALILDHLGSNFCVPKPKAGPWDLRFAYQIAKLAKKLKVDFVHTHDSQAHTFGLLAQILFGMKVKLVVHRRVDFKVGVKRLSQWKYNHRGIAGIICISQAIATIMKPALKKPEKLKTIFSSIDAKKFHPAKSRATGKLRNALGLQGEEFLIGNIAAITQQKDYFTFLDTIKILVEKEKKATYVIIGTGHQEAEIKAYCLQLGLQDKVHFLGFRKDVPEIFPELDLLLFSSETEGLGTTLLDAFACEVPVVATNAGGIPEVALHMKNAFVAPVKDAQKLAEGVILLMDNPEIRRTFVAASKEIVAQHTIEKMAQETLEYYKHLKAQQ